MTARLAECSLCGGTRGVIDPRPDGTGQHHQPIDCVTEERDQALVEAARLRLIVGRVRVVLAEYAGMRVVAGDDAKGAMVAVRDAVDAR